MNGIGCLVGTIVFPLLAIFLLAWAHNVAFRMENSRACLNRLRQLGHALGAYHAEHGSFPPAYVADEDGVPLYSWRVLLLPYLEETAVYEKLNLDEPWDGPHNYPILKDCRIRAYECPDVHDIAEPHANYLMVVGPGTISDGPGTRSRSDVKDDPRFTILLVKAAKSDAHWAEPIDVIASQCTFRVNDGSRRGLVGGPNGVETCVNCLMANGDTKAVSGKLSPELLRSMTKIADGGPSSEEIENEVPR